MSTQMLDVEVDLVTFGTLLVAAGAPHVCTLTARGRHLPTYWYQAIYLQTKFDASIV